MRLTRFVFSERHEDLLVRAGLRSFDRLWSHRGGSTVASSRTSRTVRLTPRGVPRALYLKRYSYEGWALLRTFLRGGLAGRSRARREWEALQTLREEGLNPVEAVAFGERKIWGFVRASCLLTLEVEGSATLEELLASEEDSQQIRQIVVALGSFVGRIHGRGYTMGRIRWRDVLVRLDGDPLVAKVDSSGLHKPRTRRAWLRGVVGDLASLELPARSRIALRERIRFLRAHRAHAGWSVRIRTMACLVTEEGVRQARGARARDL